MRRVLLPLPLLVLALPAPAQVLAPGDNLIVDGIPPIPAALAEQVKRYTESRSATLLDWHPTRREMLVSTRFGQTAQVHRVKMPGGARTQLTFFPEKVSGARFRPAGGESFVFGRDVGGNERYQSFRFDPETGSATLLTDGKARNSLGVWSRSGTKLAYTSTRRNGTDADLYVVDPTDPKSDAKVAELGVGWAVLDWAPGDATILASEYMSINQSYLWLVDVKTGAKKELVPIVPEKVAYSGGQYSPDGKYIWTTTDRGSEFKRLTRIDVATHAVSQFTADVNWDVEEFELSPDGKTVAFVVNEAGVGTLRLIEAEWGKTHARPEITGSVSGLKFHPKTGELAFSVASAKVPTDVFSFDPTTGKTERWTESETGGLNAASFAEPQLVKWKSFDDREISGFLYPPAKKFTGKRPVIINIHGGPEGQARPGFLGAGNYYTNELGVAVLFPNVRGSEGFGKTFLTLDNGVKREDSYKDIAALLDWIKGRPDLDADRVMVTGGSYGGHMTLAIATYYPDRIRCAVDVVGMSNLRTFLENTEPYRRDLRRAEYGDERDPKTREFMERTAPLTNVAKVSKPLFIVQGQNDPRVPASEAEQMVKALKARGTPVWYLNAKDEGHGFAKQKNREFQTAATALFVQRYLLDESAK
ncbi:S9 family peptidase [Urbifossiella limnaea]|uniref:Prolyl endopeptidase n=1 Tax=Urbifossiella limnaea TaxID=2528023 RepID=A0A517Y052_9BACT|nr:S9 family peptidase [Urbifossiella limnaea]QDU23139.1 Prolyl endopeptidase [Urbifossiella limnaea]